MPSKSEKQKKLMTIASHDKEFAEKVGVPQKVAKDFHEADKKLAEENKNAPKQGTYGYKKP